MFIGTCQMHVAMNMTENEIAKEVVDLCFRIHKQYGPGLFESVYEEIFDFEMSRKFIQYSRQYPVPLIHDSVMLDVGFRADFLIENKVILEFKSIEHLAPVHLKQVRTYLKLTGCKLGLLINFNVELIKDGIRRIVNNL